METKTALITGASRGIGRAIALTLAKAGMQVVVNYANNQDAACSTCEEIEALGVKAMAVKADIASAEEVHNMVALATEALGPVDVLVNNAGITRDGMLQRMTDEDFEAVLHTNLFGAFYCTRAVLKAMSRARWGRIINISSVVGLSGNAGQANYAAAKAGLIGLTKSVAKEVANRGVTANCIAPGFIETDMTGELSEKAEQLYLSNIPQKRFGQPEDIANLVAFLASDEAAYITGQVISADGGMHM